MVCSCATIAAGRIDFCFYAPFRVGRRVFSTKPPFEGGAEGALSPNPGAWPVGHFLLR